MSRQRDAELDRLRSAREAARQRQQAAWQAQQAAWERRSSARAVMNRAYEVKQAAYADQQAAWEAYVSIKQTNGPRIDNLNAQQERAYQNMKSAFSSRFRWLTTCTTALAHVCTQIRDTLTKQSLRPALPNGGSSSLKFAPHASGSMPSSQLSKRLRVNSPAHGRHFSLPRQSTNERRRTSNAPRPNLTHAPRPFRLGLMSSKQ